MIPVVWGLFILPPSSPYVFCQLLLGWRCHHLHGPSHSLRFHHLGHQHIWRHLPYRWPPLTRDPCPTPRIRVCLCFLLPISFSFAKKYNLTNGTQDRKIFRLWRHHRHRLYPPPRLRRQRALFTMSCTSVARIRARSPHLSILIISILIGACDVALRPVFCSRVVLRHIYCRIDCLSHRHGQAQEAWRLPWYVWSASAVASKRSTHTRPSRRIDPHGHQAGSYAAHGPEAGPVPALTDGSDPEKVGKDLQADHTHGHLHARKETSFQTDADAMAQLIGVAILEFGVILHRYVFYFPARPYPPRG
jgi:hypothetical protein